MINTLVYNSNPYKLEALAKNPVNNNKYVYLSGIDGDIEVLSTCWLINLGIYLNDNFILPANTIYLNFASSFAELNNLNITHQIAPSYPSYVLDVSSCDYYHIQFSIDTASSKFFEQKLNNFLLNLTLSFGIDYDMLNQAQLKCPATRIDSFISELKNIKFSTNLNFSNFSEGKGSDNVDIVNQYHFSNNKITLKKISSINYLLNDQTIDKKTPILKMFDIHTSNNFLINGYKIDVVYSVDNGQLKTLSCSSSDPTYVNKDISFNYPFCTKLNDKDELYNYVGDNPGIYFDKQATGYYEVTLIILVNETFYTLKLIQPFNFIDSSSPGTNIVIKKTIIDSLNNFKELNF